jgi:hypothetical protein
MKQGCTLGVLALLVLLNEGDCLLSQLGILCFQSSP